MMKMNGQDASLYDDGLVRLDRDGLTIRRYYFPVAVSKHIPYARIKEVQERQMGALTGKGRIWGTGDFRHWAPLDPQRPNKDKALILDVGKWIKPVFSPDDPDLVLSILRQKTGLS